ncbi:hypothetical protein [Cytobacillus kochii]|uniref:hypothetical protein n=1 Tax=Cytobacillus kochii TaxID=859143 RepID=UPI001CD6CC36|nr:hypothetical protein [Cytobacillus kochii]MCA1027765.1 hypothetical protein [Cytobacillus kochii]MCM3324481.1 hypothetical protein [Cytobacillus kochii]MCM3346874.1 hypothetical protein [Cytobacillus kochii]MDM5209034.1 hypothetical protein [Cytobacillus kochii]
MHYYYRHPGVADERFFPFLAAPFVGGFLGGLAGGALAAPLFFRPRPCFGGPCPPYGYGYGPGPVPYGNQGFGGYPNAYAGNPNLYGPNININNEIN